MNINNLTFNPQCPPESIELAKKWLVDNRDENFKKLCNFVIVKGGETFGYMGENCHARMAAKVGVDCIASEIGTYRQCRDWPDLVNEDLYRPFVKWLTQDSFYSRFILNRDDFDFCLRYGIVISSDVPSAVVQCILMSTRMVQECNPAAFLLFNELVDKGYPATAAYSVAFMSNISFWDYGTRKIGETFPQTISDNSDVYSHGHHRPHPYWGSTGQMAMFVKGDFGPTLKDDKNLHYRTHPTIYGTMDFCDGRNRTSNNFVKDLLKDADFKQRLKVRRGDDKKPFQVTNPFSRPKFGEVSRTPDIVTRDEMVNIVFPELKSKGIFDVVA